jgi:hypothetical protein
MMNRYIRENNLFPLTERDIEVFGNAVKHPDDERLTHHAIKDKSILYTDFTKNMLRLANILDLDVSSITAFTGKAGEECLPHIDGEPDRSYSWRLAYYAKGNNSFLNWWMQGPVIEHRALELDNKREKEGDETPTGYSVIDTKEILFTQPINMKSAFVRTDIPHSVDMTDATEDRLTLSATFFPHITWYELNEKLDRL